MGQFQFLIGTIKTSYDGQISSEFRKFQFLIGTIKTGDAYERAKREAEIFQFLIGTIKTVLA